MSRVLCAALALLLGACGRPREYSAPAPEGALQCALEEARELGYERMSGEPGEDYVRVGQRAVPPSGVRMEDGTPPAGPEGARPVADPGPAHNQLVLRESGRMLHIEVHHSPEGGESPGGGDELGSDADAHAQMILVACTGQGNG